MDCSRFREELGQKLVRHFVSQGGGAGQVGQQQVGDWLSEAHAFDQHLKVEAPNSLTGKIVSQGINKLTISLKQHH